MAGRAPPGRAGRTWLVARIDVANRAVELLEQKQQVLWREHRRLIDAVGRSEQEWLARAADADGSNVRAMVCGGRDALRRSEHAVPPADARVSWTTEAGATFPNVVEMDLPPAAFAGTPALQGAAAACRRALEAGARHAAATTALRRVESELAVTVRRLRAIRSRWVPALEAELAQLDLRLDDTDREEVTRLRWAGSPAKSDVRPLP